MENHSMVANTCMALFLSLKKQRWSLEAIVEKTYVHAELLIGTLDWTASSACNICMWLAELLRFTCTDGKVVSIPVQIATKYVQFGTFLLNDRNGSKVKIIARKNHYDAEQINTEIFQEWLDGRGKKPVTWTTLVEVLRDIELSILAGDIKAIKCPGRPTPKDQS